MRLKRFSFSQVNEQTEEFLEQDISIVNGKELHAAVDSLQMKVF